MTWMQRLRRVFGIDIGHCPRCGASLRVVAVITNPRVISVILEHLDTRYARAPRWRETAREVIERSLREAEARKRKDTRIDTMTKVAVYARYFSDNQREASIEDQFRLCREYAKRQGWQLVESYSDQSISGARLLRPGIQTLLADAQSKRFNVILAESRDRISRD
jgi:predicted site-specific integrase-resolvase